MPQQSTLGGGTGEEMKCTEKLSRQFNYLGEEDEQAETGEAAACCQPHHNC